VSSEAFSFINAVQYCTHNKLRTQNKKNKQPSPPNIHRSFTHFNSVSKAHKNSRRQPQRHRIDRNILCNRERDRQSERERGRESKLV